MTNLRDIEHALDAVLANQKRIEGKVDMLISEHNEKQSENLRDKLRKLGVTFVCDQIKPEKD